MIDFTKCANFKNCGNSHVWTKEQFNSKETDVEKIKVFLCENCLKGLGAGYTGVHFSLKNAYEKMLKGEGKWTNIKCNND